MSERIYLSPPDVGEAEETLVVDALRSGWVAPIGPHVDAFEAEMATRCGREHAVALASGTAALHLGLLELGAGPGTVVVVPTMTFAATANAVVYTGAEPVFVDCDPVTGNIDPQLLDDALRVLRAEGAKVVAAVPVDLLGRCADYDAILEICGRHDVAVLEDAAEALGSSYKGQPAGSFGQASVLSFNGNKIMTTSGGGMLLTDDERLAQRVRHLSTQAREPAVHYEHVEVGYNYRLSNILAALGLGQLRRLDEMMGRRRVLRCAYQELVSDIEGVTVFQVPGDDGDNCWLTAVLVDGGACHRSAAELNRLLSSQNIESRPLWKPMHAQPAFRAVRSFTSGAADRLFEQGLALPSSSALVPHQIDVVLEALRQGLGSQHSSSVPAHGAGRVRSRGESGQ